MYIQLSLSIIMTAIIFNHQGFFVAVLYCLLNGEVRQELWKFYHRHKGDPLLTTYNSTVISHTKTYVRYYRDELSCLFCHVFLKTLKPILLFQTELLHECFKYYIYHFNSTKNTLKFIIHVL